MVLADWWFSLALSKDIYQPIRGKRMHGQYSWLTRRVIASSESQPLKGLSDTLAAIASRRAKPALTGVGIKNFLDSCVSVEGCGRVRSMFRL
jgi:hypothetical protein